MVALKTLVIGMGILILIGFGVLVYGLSTQIGSQETSKRSISGSDPAVPFFPEVDQQLGDGKTPPYRRYFNLGAWGFKAGAEILDSNLEAGQLVMTIKPEDGGRAFVILEIGTGRVIGQIRIAPGK